MRNPEKTALAPGLYLVATPIGNARDITLRALDILASADVLAAEDTRSLRRLLDLHGLAPGDRPLLSYHDHNGPKMRPRLLGLLAEGRSVAYASEAGTPLLADPGFDLARDASAAGHAVTAAPGASALLAALSLAGLPTDRFLFGGFLPNAQAARKAALAELAQVPATLVFYESPRRAQAMLEDAAEMLGASRPAALCRELTKRFEEVRQGSLMELAQGARDTPPKGEVVVVIGRGDSENVSESDVEAELRAALDRMSLKDAADAVARATGAKRRDVYQMALRIGREG